MDQLPPRPVSKVRYCVAIVAAIIGLVASCALSYQVTLLVEQNRQLRADIDELFSKSAQPSNTNEDARARLNQMIRDFVDTRTRNLGLQRTLDYYKQENAKLEDKVDGFREWLATESQKDPALKVVSAKVKNALDYDELPVEEL